MRSLMGRWVGAVVVAGPMTAQNPASSSTVLSEIRAGATGTDHVLYVINRSDRLKAGSAVLLVEPPRPPGTSGGEPKGASRVLVHVVP